MKPLHNIVVIVISIIGVNITHAADSSFEPMAQEMDINNEVLFLKTKNILDLEDQLVLDDSDNLINQQRKTDLKRILRRIDGVKGDYLQVLPGNENPMIGSNGSEGRVDCDASICRSVGENAHSVINDQGKKIINYSLEGFQSVGILVTYLPDDSKKVCNFVIISSEWLLTARHCIDEDNLNLNTAWLVMRSTNIIQPDLPLEFNGCDKNNNSTEKDCTFHKLKLSDNQPKQLWKDGADLALIKIDHGGLPSDFSNETIPELDFSDAKYKIVTLVGNGQSNIDNYRHRRPLVGWFKGKFTDDSNITFLESSSIDTKPAPGDSGSPVYRGEYFGRKCELNESKVCSPYLLSAIVTSGVSSKGKVTKPKDAQDAKTKVIRLSNYKDFICGSAKDIKGCDDAFNP